MDKTMKYSDIKDELKYFASMELVKVMEDCRKLLMERDRRDLIGRDFIKTKRTMGYSVGDE